MKRRLLRLMPVLLALLLAAHATAHDYWLEADSFFLPADAADARVHLHLGEALQSEEERPFQKERTARFKLISAAGTQDLIPSTPDGQTPVARLSFGKAGNYLLAMERKASTIKLDALKFEEYLAAEGLDSVILERRRSGESGKEGRENYSRYLKILLQVGADRDETFGQNVGHMLEITPTTNPYRLKVGDKFSVRVTFDGHPLAGAQIFAHNRHQGSVRTQVAVTSGDGVATFAHERPGVWLVRLVHMRRCAGAGCGGSDWESFWGALTFGSR